tara:strand:+ start:1774 stop:3207 length:1434 start_codon:yes stop_codon:yes gene_type:complete
MRLFIQLIIFLLFACRPPLDPIVKTGCTDSTACNYDVDAQDDDGSCEYAQENFDCDEACFDLDEDGLCDHVGNLVQFFEMLEGDVLDADLTQDHLVLAADLKGYLVFDINRDMYGNIESVDSIFNDSDMDPGMGDNRAEEVVISEEHNIVFITDRFDRIWLYKLDENAIQYGDPEVEGDAGEYLSDCLSGIWLSTDIEDESDHIKVFSLIKIISSEGDSFSDDYSTTLTWRGIYDVGLNDIEIEENVQPGCELSYNFGALAEKISFDNGFLAVSNDQLGVHILKQRDVGYCVDNEEYQIIEDFDPLSNDYDCLIPGEGNINVCESTTFADQDGDGEYEDCPDAYNGTYQYPGGFDPNPISLHFPGEVNSVLMRNSVLFAGLSTSNGCYMSLLDGNGGVITNLQIADGYTINATAASDRLIALAAGHDGVLLFEWDGTDFASIQSLGQINTPYCNNIEIDGNNLIISTEDGLYIYLIQ